MSGTPPERTPPKPDPRITPTTMKGNYPAQYKTFTRTLLKCSACGATMWKHGGAMACLSYECQPKTKPPNRQRGTEHTIGLSTGRETRQPSYSPYTKSSPRPPPAPSRPTRDSSRKSKHEPPTFWQSMLAYALRFIDRLNGQVGIYEDDKHMPDGEEMATLAELFEEVEQVDERPEPPRPPRPPGYTICKR